MSHKTSLAAPEDGKRILEILECSPAKGSIELLYTRRPDACLSYGKESPDTRVFVVKEGEQVIGTAAEVIRQVYIGGETRKLCYICGLKKDIHYPGAVNWGKVFIRNLVREDIDCYFCSIISDNTAAQKLFEKKRRRTLNMEFLQQYTTYMLAPYFHFKVRGSYTFRRARPEDEGQIIEFLNSQGRKKDFFPVFESLEQFSDLHAEDFYILEENGGIAAVGALWNQGAYRQYIVKKYRGAMVLARFCNPILKLLGYIQLPKENEPLDFPMLSFFVSRDDSEEYGKAFLNHIVPEIRKNYGMFVIGTTATGFANNILKGLRSLHFDSRIYAIDFIYGGGKSQKIDKENLFLECGLL